MEQPSFLDGSVLPDSSRRDHPPLIPGNHRTLGAIRAHSSLPVAPFYFYEENGFQGNEQPSCISSKNGGSGTAGGGFDESRGRSGKAFIRRCGMENWIIWLVFLVGIPALFFFMHRGGGGMGCCGGGHSQHSPGDEKKKDQGKASCH